MNNKNSSKKASTYMASLTQKLNKRLETLDEASSLHNAHTLNNFDLAYFTGVNKRHKDLIVALKKSQITTVSLWGKTYIPNFIYLDVKEILAESMGSQQEECGDTNS